MESTNETEPKVSECFAAFLFIDVEDSVSVGRFSPVDHYQNIQQALAEVAEKVKEFIQDQIGKTDISESETSLPKSLDPEVRGDEVLFVFVFKKDINFSCKQNMSFAVFWSLIAALVFKRLWYECELNQTISSEMRPKIEIACGIHCGTALYDEENQKTSGYHLGYAKRIETISRFGRYTHIVLSHEAFCSLMQHERLSLTDGARGNSLRPAYTVKQILFFDPLNTQNTSSKDIPNSSVLHELKFYTRLDEYAGFKYEALGLSKNQKALTGIDNNKSEKDRKSIAKEFMDLSDILPIHPYRETFWEYNYESERLLDDFMKLHNSNSVHDQLESYYVAQEAIRIAHNELLFSNVKEKVYLDLAFWNMVFGDYEGAIECCKMALKHNSELDIVFQIMASAFNKKLHDCKRKVKKQECDELIEWSLKALYLSPGSASNHYQYARACHFMKGYLSEEDTSIEGDIRYYKSLARRHLEKTNELDPSYVKRPGVKKLYKEYEILKK